MKTLAEIETLTKQFADTLIKTDEYLYKSALKSLTVAELEAIGCTVQETGDQVIIRATDKEVDKVVNALLRDAVEEATETAVQ